MLRGVVGSWACALTAPQLKATNKERMLSLIMRTRRQSNAIGCTGEYRLQSEDIFDAVPSCDDARRLVNCVRARQ